MLTRRVVLIGSVATIAVPRAAWAQGSGKAWRIGVLAGVPSTDAHWVAFRDRLRDLGYVDGKNIAITHVVYRTDDAHMLKSARELVSLGVDVIVTRAISAAKRATETIPIVMTEGLRVVEMGLVKSLARPGTNVTGSTWDVTTEEATKRLQLLKELIPNMSRLANVWNPRDPGTADYWPDVRTGAKALGLAVDSVPVSDAAELERALGNLARDRPSAVFFWGGTVQYLNQRKICDWAIGARMPTLVLLSGAVERGCLMNYAPSSIELYRKAAEYVDKIFRGARADELPISRPSKFILAINLKTAKALGLTIPPSLLLRADQVLE